MPRKSQIMLKAIAVDKKNSSYFIIAIIFRYSLMNDNPLIIPEY
jgi:hypothetical protein